LINYVPWLFIEAKLVITDLMHNRKARKPWYRHASSCRTYHPLFNTLREPKRIRLQMRDWNNK
jgi:hypothetical protein